MHSSTSLLASLAQILQLYARFAVVQGAPFSEIFTIETSSSIAPSFATNSFALGLELRSEFPDPFSSEPVENQLNNTFFYAYIKIL
ncbi:hypothetical protein L6452_32549 [Arctium lappa]|uniref:Uncharacterized protein n=1 Tax=Arctium lappa TaxID=4217 RepID=A0ACB8Z5A9_ARCLA|nr:hypothetical protein L6452_32549 [Arctium lappa]